MGRPTYAQVATEMMSGSTQESMKGIDEYVSIPRSRDHLPKKWLDDPRRTRKMTCRKPAA